MKRAITFLLLLYILVFIPIQNSKGYTTTGTLNNKTLTSDIAIKDGDVVMIGYSDSVSSKTHNDMEIYNINKLDNFIKSTNIGKEDKIRIVEYENNVTGTWVNKIYELNYDGKKIIDIEYDTYSNPNAFIPSQPYIFNKIIKKDYPDGISYRICGSKNDENDDCAKLISFYKNSIVDKKE